MANERKLSLQKCLLLDSMPRTTLGLLIYKEFHDSWKSNLGKYLMGKYCSGKPSGLSSLDKVVKISLSLPKDQ